jgi:multidrug efflux pump subunit AcrB
MIPASTSPVPAVASQDEPLSLIATRPSGAAEAALPLPEGAVVKVVEPPPGPPVMSTLLAEIYGPDAETRRAVARKVREAFGTVPYIVDVDDSFGIPAERLRLTLDDANLDFHKIEPGDVFDTIALLYGGKTVGYSHRSDGREPIAIRLAPSKADRVVNERGLATPVPANLLPGDRSVVELGDVVNIDKRMLERRSLGRMNRQGIERAKIDKFFLEPEEGPPVIAGLAP